MGEILQSCICKIDCLDQDKNKDKNNFENQMEHLETN